MNKNDEKIRRSFGSNNALLVLLLLFMVIRILDVLFMFNSFALFNNSSNMNMNNEPSSNIIQQRYKVLTVALLYSTNVLRLGYACARAPRPCRIAQRPSLLHRHCASAHYLVWRTSSRKRWHTTVHLAPYAKCRRASQCCDATPGSAWTHQELFPLMCLPS